MRLMEGIRLLSSIDSAYLVCSGYASSGRLNLASVFKIAAISMGIDSSRIYLLESPTTTQEEAKALAAHFSTDSQLILVTSAIHMQRAIVIFKHAGFKPIPAPVNFLVKEDDNPFHLGFLPSADNLRIMDAIIREWMGTIRFILRGNAS